MIRSLLILPLRAARLPLRLARRVARRAARTLGLDEPAAQVRPAVAPGREPQAEWRPAPLEEEAEVEVEATAALARIAAGEPVVLVDVREVEEVLRTGAAAGALRIPLGQLALRLDELPRDRPVVVYCAAGMRSHSATSYLREQGYSDAWSVVGGLPSWMRAGGAVVPVAPA